MRLVYVTEGVPNRDPERGDGSSLIPYGVLGALPDDVEVTLLTYTGDVPVPPEVAARCADVQLLRPRDPRLALLRSLVSRAHPGAEAVCTPEARAAVARLSADADVTLVHGPHVTPLVHAVRGPVVLQAVDPWSMRLGMEVELATGLRRRFRARKARQALVAERALPQRVRLLTVGQRDAERWSALLGRPVRAVPNGTETPAGPRVRVPGPPTVCFVGSLHYEPNIESATVLVREVAPQVWEQAPGTRFLLAGRQPTPAVLALAEDRVEVRPNVPSMADVFAESDVAVFPDRHGLGIRNSVTEALAAGLPVVATAAGAREQPPHPLLRVAGSEGELVRLVREALTGQAAGPGPATPAEPVRTWRTVAEEYLEECRASLSQVDR
ncbi:Glycosyltransferase involved in cell wall bisynthesis [Geodermatophilus telluris]|uniref:Glycosyltransferase involved in cell wall bisynthesis n=1 Tax=Geodermatophilus telluris TaxID=1190417 RepID=A0A1G6L8L9_9ACTN|nr:glycosyltransferase [Geodermatophilus telluris]SDC39483.1 Glycosyltransferase involved in cell wall bisynthesis [Geodermatophilus telluris]